MKNRKVLDSWALLAYLQGEPSGVGVRDLLKEAQAGKVEALMSPVNLGEVYDCLIRALGRPDADTQMAGIRLLPIRFVAVTDTLVMEAARVKAAHGIAYAGCFAIATAQAEGAAVVTGDPEFEAVEGAVNVEWL